MDFTTTLLLVILLFTWPSLSQLIGPVGVTTPLHEKTRVCNILDYGGVPNNYTDVSLSIHRAFEECIKPQPKSRLVVPRGNYLLRQSIVLSNGTNWAFQLDGLITAAYVGNLSTAYTVPRELILQGYAGVEALNGTINGEGDGKFLQNLIVIVNGSVAPLHTICHNADESSCRF
jgi:rhamnogalacturonan hydrolase